MAEQSQGTEYTLQGTPQQSFFLRPFALESLLTSSHIGVMRFLQLEWHNHERARNAWDIERAEMKAKIAKQEGDCRSARKLNDLLDKQVRMLEKALKHERAKNRAIAAGEQWPSEDDVKQEWGGRIGIGNDAPNGTPSSSYSSSYNSLPRGRLPLNFLRSTNLSCKGQIPNERDTRNNDRDAHDSEREAQRDNSKLFLQKCVEELTYLLTPPAHPIPPHPSSSNMSDFQHTHDMPPSASDPYMQQPPAHHHPRRHHHPTASSNLPSLPNHHPPPVRSNNDYYVHPSQQQHSRMPVQSQNQQHPDAMSMGSMEEGSQYSQQLSARNQDEDVEQVTHSFDAYGRQVPSTETMDVLRPSMSDDTNGWNFDDSNTLLDTPPEVPPPQRSELDHFPSASSIPAKSSPRNEPGLHRRKGSSSSRRRGDASHEGRDSLSSHSSKGEIGDFKVRFALRGHLDVVRSIIFTGGGSPSEPEICTTGDDGTIKRWTIPSNYANQPNVTPNDLDIQSYFTHRGHDGMVTCLATCPATHSFSTGGRAVHDGWVFSGGQDSSIRVWERGRVDPKATLDGHTDAVWTICVLPGTSASIFGHEPRDGSPTSLSAHMASNTPSEDRVLVASGSADQTVKIWAVSAPPQLTSPSHASGSRRGVGGSRRHSVTSGSGFPSSPQPNTASGTPFYYSLIHSIEFPRGAAASPTCISPLGPSGEHFVVSYSDSSVLIFDTRTGEEMVGMASGETYDGTQATGVNSVVVTSSNASAGGDHSSGGQLGVMSHSLDSGKGVGSGMVGGEEEGIHGATGSASAGGVEGVVITGHEDRFVRFFDANSGKSSFSSHVTLFSKSLVKAQITNGCVNRSMYIFNARPSVSYRSIITLTRRA